jgi:hypothetical protein
MMTPLIRTNSVLALAFCCGAALVVPGVSAGERARPDVKDEAAGERPRSAALTFDVVVEDVDLVGNTITARSYCHVNPPSGSIGGVVYSGCLPPGAKPTRYERLTVMPGAGLKDKGLRPGMRATLRLDIVKSAAVVVVGVERPVEPERIGIDWLDAPAPKAGR